MTFSQSLVQYGSGPVIAAGALLVSQGLTNRRDSRRLMGERSEREARRRDDLQERWRDQRQQAHVQMVDYLHSGIAAAVAAASLMDEQGHRTAQAQGAAQHLYDSVASMAQHLATIFVVAGDASRQKAEEAQNVLSLTAGLLASPVYDAATNDRFAELLRALLDVQEEYLDAIRAELGTA